MERTEDEKLMDRVATARDGILCRYMEQLYRSLSREELRTLWERRGEVPLANNEALLVRAIIRSMDDLGQAPAAPRLPPGGAVDWWPAPRGQG